MLDAVLDGYTATIFAYGQTGSGKTYTVSGAQSNRNGGSSRSLGQAVGDRSGLMQRACSYLYTKMAQHPSLKYTVRTTFLEIYNEQVVDLIEPSSAVLAVRGSSRGGFYVEDLSVTQCRNEADLQYVIQKGLENRTRRNHALNSESSRSHSIFSIYLDVIDPTGERPVRYGRISLLDLAGSENVRNSLSHGVGLKEASSINRSLFALGLVIKALAVEGRATTKNAAHIPYRDSTLTKLLSDSLGGNSLTLMIACCSTLAAYGEESMRTLQYACSAGAIRNRPMVKLDPQEQLIAELKDEVQKLKQQVKYLTYELTISNSRLAEHGLETPASSSPRPLSVNTLHPPYPPPAPLPATLAAPPPEPAAAPASTWAPRQVTVNLAALCDDEEQRREGGLPTAPQQSTQQPPPPRPPVEKEAVPCAVVEVEVEVDESEVKPSFETERTKAAEAVEPPHDRSTSPLARASSAAPHAHATADSSSAQAAFVSVDLREAVVAAEERAAVSAQLRTAALSLSADFAAAAAAAELTGTIGSEQAATGAGDESGVDLDSPVSGRSASPPLGSRRTRERELEKQLRSLSTFSATDVIIAQAEGRKLNGRHASRERLVAECTVSLADVELPLGAPVAITRASSRDGASRDGSLSTLGLGKSGRLQHDHSSSPVALDSQTRAALGNVNGVDPLQEYREKARALRAREFELERSLRSLSKYSATAIIANGRS